MSPSDFGLLYLAISIASFAYVIVDWGFAAVVVRETARHPEKSGLLLGSSLLTRATSALIACLCAVAATWLLGYDAQTRLLAGVLILCWMPQYLGLSFGWTFRGHERMDCDATLNVVLKLATLLGSVACFALGGHLLGVGVCMVIGRVHHTRSSHLDVRPAPPSRDQGHDANGTYAAARRSFIGCNVTCRCGRSAFQRQYSLQDRHSRNRRLVWRAIQHHGYLGRSGDDSGMTIYPRLSKATENPAEFSHLRDFVPVAVAGSGARRRWHLSLC